MAPSQNNDRRATEAGTNSGNASKSADKKPAPKEPPKDYIHVRARRGQATDSHSLAERVSSYPSHGLFTSTFGCFLNSLVTEYYRDQNVQLLL